MNTLTPKKTNLTRHLLIATMIIITLVIVGVGPFGVATVHALEIPTGNSTLGGVLGSNDIVIAFSKLLALGLGMISQLLWPLLMFGSGLLKSDFLYSGAMDVKLTEIWIQVRNLVNIIYVILLLAVALYNVLGLGEAVDFLEIRKALPKIILGLILVNFSYTAVKVVLDVVNVGTVFAFSLPRTDASLSLSTATAVTDAGDQMCAAQKAAEEINTAVAKDPTEQAALDKKAADIKTADAKCEKDYKKDKKKDKYDACVLVQHPGEQDASKKMCDASGHLNKDESEKLSKWNIDGAFMVLAVRFMRMQDLGKVAKQIETNVTMSKLAINMLFSIMMYLVYAVSFVVLIIVLFARAAMLWMIIVFSPFIAIQLTFPNLVSQMGGGGDIAKKVTSTLLAPIIIGFVLSIGYILLSAMQGINYDSALALTNGAATSNLDTFQDILIAIGSVVFVWLGVESASSNAIGGSIAGTVMSAAKGAGTWIAEAPFKHLPVFTIPGPHGTHGEMVSLGTLSSAITEIPHEWAKDERAKTDRLLQAMGFNKTSGIEGINTRAGLNKFLGEQGSDYVSKNQDAIQKAIKEIETKEGKLKSGVPADEQLLKIRMELDKKPAARDPGVLDRAAGIIRDKNKPAEVKPDGTAAKPDTSATGKDFKADTFADKEKNKGMIEQNKKYLGAAAEAEANKAVAAADDAAYKALESKQKVAAQHAIEVGRAKLDIEGSGDVDKFIAAANSGDSGKIGATKTKFKTVIDAQKKKLADQGIAEDAQAQAIGDAISEAMKKTSGADAGKVAAAVKTALGTSGDAVAAQIKK